MTGVRCTPLTTRNVSLPKGMTPCTVVQDDPARSCKMPLHLRARYPCTFVQGIMPLGAKIPGAVAEVVYIRTQDSIHFTITRGRDYTRGGISPDISQDSEVSLARREPGSAKARTKVRN